MCEYKFTGDEWFKESKVCFYKISRGWVIPMKHISARNTMSAGVCIENAKFTVSQGHIYIMSYYYCC